MEQVNRGSLTQVSPRVASSNYKLLGALPTPIAAIRTPHRKTTVQVLEKLVKAAGPEPFERLFVFLSGEVLSTSELLSQIS